MAFIKEHLEKDYDINFPTYWKKVFSEYKNDTSGDRVWFAGPTSYVFSLSGVRFAVDLQVRRDCDFEKIVSALIEDTSALSFVLITHQHVDHMCIPLMRALKDSPIVWYIPEGTHENLIEKTEIPREKIVRVKNGEAFKIGDVLIKAFDSTHERPGEKQIFEQLGYEITTSRGKLLLPADVRNYDLSFYPDFSDIDVCFSHLWAGNDSVNAEKYIPLLHEFCDFYSHFRAKRYFFSHLYEIGRDIPHMWRYTHAALAMEMFLDRIPTSEITLPHL